MAASAAAAVSSVSTIDISGDDIAQDINTYSSFFFTTMTQFRDLYLAFWWQEFKTSDTWGWPFIQTILLEFDPWLLPLILFAFAGINLVIVSLKTSGFNLIAVFFSGLKQTLQDQPIDGDITMFTIFDWFIDTFEETS